MTAPKAKPWIDEIRAYVPGRASADGGVKPIKLSSNENPLGCSPRAAEAMAKAADGMNRYPDGGSEDLRAAIAAHHNLEAERIVCGTGSDEILQLLALAYAGPGDEVLYVRHGFMVYPLAAQRVGAVPVAAPDKDYTADVDALLAAITDKTRLLYLANPNNPTGTMLCRAEVERLHAGLRKNIVLVLDAAYAEYVDNADYEDGIAMAREHANVITTRTFSKLYGLAGTRVGWAYGPQAIIDTLNRIRGPFNVTRDAQHGAIAALQDGEWTREARDENARVRGQLISAIDALGNKGLKAVPSEANFVLVRFPEDGPLAAERVYQHLTGENILTRWLPEQGLPHEIRVSVGTEAETERFTAALRAYVESVG